VVDYVRLSQMQQVAPSHKRTWEATLTHRQPHGLFVNTNKVPRCMVLVCTSKRFTG
jgi:hypothetical protein